MADYTSTQNGNWNTDATWGGAGHPSVAGDTATIAHEVTFDRGDDTVTFGNITLNSGGVLIFPINANSTLYVGDTSGANNAVLTVNSGGELRAGTDGAPIAAAYHCRIYFQRSAAGYSLVLNDGGIINIYGDTAFYGASIADRYADLDSDWTAGQTLYITGDYSAKWQSGQKFYIHENIHYDGYQNDGHTYTIDTVGAYDVANDRTPITIVEAAPGITFNAIHDGHQSKLIMVSRNVELADPNSSWDVYGYGSYAEVIRFDNNQDSSNQLSHLENCVIRGWDKGSDSGYNLIANSAVYLNCNSGIYSGTSHQITGDIVSCYEGIRYGTSHQITGDIISCAYGIRYGTNYQITGDIVSCNSGIYSGTNYQITGDIVSCNSGIYSGTNNRVTGDIVCCNSGIYQGTNNQVTGDFNGNTTDISLASSSNKYFAVLEGCTIDGINRRAIRIYQNSGNWLPLVSSDTDWQTPDSGIDWILQAVANSYNTGGGFSLNQMELSPANFSPMAQRVDAGSRTITFKIWPVGWTPTLDQDDIYLEAWYLDEANTPHRAKVVTGAGTFDNGAWRELTVSFTAGQAGIVYFNLVLARYQASAYVLVDPQPSFS